MYFVAAGFIQRVGTFAIGMKLGGVPLAIVHGVHRLIAWHRFVVTGGKHLTPAHLELRLERMVADIAVDGLMDVLDAHNLILACWKNKKAPLSSGVGSVDGAVRGNGSQDMANG